MSNDQILSRYSKELKQAITDPNIQLAMSRSVQAYRKNVQDALDEFPETKLLAEEVIQIKEKSIDNLNQLLQKAMKKVQDNHGHAYFAKTKEDTLNIISDIVGTKKLIVKGKSILGEELEIREHLIGQGNEVWETDLGEFIIQLRNERPMHIVAPSVHVPREQVAETLSKFFKKEIPPDVNLMVETVKEFLRAKYFQADFGISGANVAAADTGALFIIENEGNVRLSTGAPPVHIAIVGIEKIVPTTQDAFKVAEVTWRFAGYKVPSYLNMISGPSKTGDIEKITIYGAHGPKELHVIFVDNGRSEMAGTDIFKQALHCLRCGGCMYDCPVFQLTAGHFGYRYMGGIGTIWTAFTAGGIEHAAPLIYTCLRCGRCIERCPMKIDVPKMVLELRKILVEKSKA